MSAGFTVPLDCVQEFLDKGVTVIPSLLSEEEVARSRGGLHAFLSTHGVDAGRLAETASALRALSSTGGSGGVLDVFYEGWQLALVEHPRVFAAMSQLWAASYARCASDGPFLHPYGRFDPNRGFLYLDRLCFRVPDTVSALHADGVGKKRRGLQRSLTPHLDCCPHDLYASSNKKWRPVQAFLALTDTLDKDQGGFEACPGLHLEFEEWVRRRAGSSASSSDPPCVGQFSPIRPREDAEVLARMRHVPCRAGDLVCWDIRTPHSNSRFNHCDIAREAVYIGLLPYTQLNRSYAQHQLQQMRAGELPCDQWREGGTASHCAVQYAFSELGQKLMAIKEW